VKRFVPDEEEKDQAATRLVNLSAFETASEVILGDPLRAQATPNNGR